MERGCSDGHFIGPFSQPPSIMDPKFGQYVKLQLRSKKEVLYEKFKIKISTLLIMEAAEKKDEIMGKQIVRDCCSKERMQ